jgi:hemoglobin
MTDPVPTLFEWLGGTPALKALIQRFYERVPEDAVLAPLFAHASPKHAEHVERFVAEVLGGPKSYSAELGGHPAMVHKHVGRSLTEPQRQCWMQLLLQCADELGVPSDPEFRSAFVAYLEWGTRLAVINSQPGADTSGSAPMPSWGWGEAKGPYVPK